MSLARARFLQDIAGLTEAVSLDPVAAGASSAPESLGVVILRRGILITGLIALETFVRERTSEVLGVLGNWPASYEDLPIRLRDAALMDALPNLQRYARMLKRQQEDYETELRAQIALMSMNRGPTFGFSKFTAGDYTGNISDTSIQELLSSFQVKNCWRELRDFSADVGFGVPSVHELVKDVVRKRHRSAHSSNYVPTVADIADLAANLTCIGICFDVAMSASVACAIYKWKDWSDGNCNWRDQVALYFVEPFGSKARLKKIGQSRALRVLQSEGDAVGVLPLLPAGSISVLVTRDDANRPQRWKIV